MSAWFASLLMVVVGLVAAIGGAWLSAHCHHDRKRRSTDR